MVNKRELDAMSAMATPGIWYAVGMMVEVESDKWADPAYCDTSQYSQGHLRGNRVANTAFIAMLVNLYRSGELVLKDGGDE